jgi:hypothetical protein
MDHATRHRDGMLQDFIRDAELFEGMNPSCRKRQIDRAASDQISFPRVRASLVELNIVSPPPEIRREQSAGQPAPDKNKFGWHESGANAPSY